VRERHGTDFGVCHVDTCCCPTATRSPAWRPGGCLAPWTSPRCAPSGASTFPAGHAAPRSASRCEAWVWEGRGVGSWPWRTHQSGAECQELLVSLAVAQLRLRLKEQVSFMSTKGRRLDRRMVTCHHALQRRERGVVRSPALPARLHAPAPPRPPLLLQRPRRSMACVRARWSATLLEARQPLCVQTPQRLSRSQPVPRLSQCNPSPAQGMSKRFDQAKKACTVRASRVSPLACVRTRWSAFTEASSLQLTPAISEGWDVTRCVCCTHAHALTCTSTGSP
jgi:hypothetical protein